MNAVYDHCATKNETKVDDPSDIKIETENAFYGQGYPGAKYNRYRPTRGGRGGRSRGGFNRGPQKNLIVREIKLPEMGDRPDVIYVSPFLTGQLIAQTNLLTNQP